MDQRNIIVSVLALSSAISSGTSAILAKYSTYKIKPLVVNFLRSLTGSIVLFMIISVISPNWYKNLLLYQVLIVLYIAFMGPFLAWYLYIKSLSLGDVSLVHPITNTYPFTAIIVAYFLIHEIPSIFDIVGGILILFGVKIISSREKSKGKKISITPILYSIMVSILWGVNTTLFKFLLFNSNPLSLALLRSLFSAMIMFPIVIKNIGKEIKNTRYTFSAIGTGITSDTVGIILWLTSLQVGKVSNAAVLSSTAPLFSAVFSTIFLKERPPPKRWLGILITIVGIVLVSL